MKLAEMNRIECAIAKARKGQHESGRFLIESVKTGAILSQQGNFEASRLFGPVFGFVAKTWKSREAAERYAAQRWNQGGRKNVIVTEIF